MIADVIGAGGAGRGSRPEVGELRGTAPGNTAPDHKFPDRKAFGRMPQGDMTRGGIAASAALHSVVLALVLLGLPNLFRKPPLRDMPIAVRLVTVAPDTRATAPNP